MDAQGTDFLITTLIFISTVGLVAAMVVFGIRQAGRRVGEQPAITRRWTIGVILGLALWLTLTAALASSGMLHNFERIPPPMLLLAAASVLGTLLLAGSPLGARLALGLNISWLVAFQAFRILVELCLAQLYHLGVVPVQMTIEGLNFDLLSGLTALLIAGLAARDRLPAWGLLLWNSIGLGLLFTIIAISTVSMPLPVRVFFNEPANTIITDWPFVWLPTFLVQMALFGHLLVFRRLWCDRRISTQTNAALVAKVAEH